MSKGDGMADITDRLRHEARTGNGLEGILLLEAVNEIERLRAVLREITETKHIDVVREMVRIDSLAIEALA